MNFEEKIIVAKSWIKIGYDKITIVDGKYVLSNGTETVKIDEEIYDYLVKKE